MEYGLFWLGYLSLPIRIRTTLGKVTLCLLKILFANTGQPMDVTITLDMTTRFLLDS